MAREAHERGSHTAPYTSKGDKLTVPGEGPWLRAYLKTQPRPGQNGEGIVHSDLPPICGSLAGPTSLTMLLIWIIGVISHQLRVAWSFMVFFGHKYDSILP